MFFDSVSMVLQSNSRVCFSLRLHMVVLDNSDFFFCYKVSHDRRHCIFEITEGRENHSLDIFCQHVRDCNQLLEVCIVNPVDRINCKVPEFVFEEWPRPPLRL